MRWQRRHFFWDKMCMCRFRWYFRLAGLPASQRFTSLSCIWARSDKARRSGAGRTLAGRDAAVGNVAGRERRDLGRLRVRRGSDRAAVAGGTMTARLTGESACPTKTQALAHQRGTDAFVCQPSDLSSRLPFPCIGSLDCMVLLPGRTFANHDNGIRLQVIPLFLSGLQPATM